MTSENQVNINKRAEELVKKGDDALQRFGWFGLMNASKTDDAIRFYTKAANSFKMSQNFERAGEIFAKLADLELRDSSSSYEASNHFINAAQMFQNVDKAKCINFFEKGKTLLIDEGRFGIAAKHAESMGGIYEKEIDIDGALKYYKEASTLFISDNSPSRSNKNVEKIGTLSARKGDYKTAFESFSKLGKSSLESNLLKFNAKKHFFHALLCLLARNDLVAVGNSLEEFKNLDYSFEDSREYKLIVQLRQSVEDLNINEFADVLYAYDSVSKLNPWQTELLLKVKDGMVSTAEEVPDLR